MRLALIQIAYLLATALFVFALHWMNDPRCGRHVPGGGRHHDRAWNHSLGLDRASAGSRLRGRCAVVPGPVNCRSPTNSAVACVRRSCRRSRWDRRVLPLATAECRKAYGFSHDGDHCRDHSWLPDFYGQPYGRRKAPRNQVDSAAPGHVPAAERKQPFASWDRGRLRHRFDLQSSSAGLSLSCDHRPGAGVWDSACHPDRWSRHAHCDLTVEFLCGPVGRRDGLRSRQQTAGHRGSAGRFLRSHPLDHYVPRHEPLLHKRPFWRLRTGAGEGAQCRG